jgi:hypothetical protein
LSPAFVHGCNYPWSADAAASRYGLDFGANVWGSHLGVSTRRDRVAQDFAAMADLGFTIARWFVFCDGRSGIAYDDRGLPVGPDPHLCADLDAALEIAGQTGVRLCLVLLDHLWMFDGVPDVLPDPASGILFEARLPQGRANVLRTAAGRDALFTRIIEPLVHRYGRSGARADLGAHIFAFEFLNEPDFIVEEWERDLSPRVSAPIAFEALAESVARLSGLVHAQTAAVTTMAAARLRNLWAWDDDSLGLDLLQVHSYPDTKAPRHDDVFGRPAASLGTRRPVVLGEFPGNGPAQHPAGASPPPTTLEEYLEFALASGYAGAWPWSFSGTDAYGRVPAEPLLAFARRHPGLVNPRALRNRETPLP